MKQFNSARRLPGMRIAVRDRLNGGCIINVIALFAGVTAASLPPRATVRIGAR
jgi:hypothetical protein